MKRVGFGIIGCGVIAPSHASAITENNRARLIGVCDIVEEKAIKLKEDYKADFYYTNYMDMLSNPDIDIVNICTPSGIRGDIAMAAARAGKHVFAEKPMEITSEKISEMVETCRNQGVKLGCVFQLRTKQTVLAVKKALEQGVLGKIIMADAYMKYYRSQEYYDSAGWRGTWELDGGGALMNQCIHGIDLLQWFVGDVESVLARADALARNIQVEDSALAILKYKNGAIGVIQGATSIYPAQELRIEIHGEKGSIILTDSGIKQWYILGQEKQAPQEIKEEKVGGFDDPKEISHSGHYIQVNDMISAVLDDREPMVTGESGRKAVELILAIYKAARQGKEVYINKEN